MALGDVDRDGHPDLVCGNEGQNRLYLNLLRHLDAPLPLRVGQTYTLDAYMRYGPVSQGDFALPAVSFAPASVPSPFGTIGIGQPWIALPLILIPQPAGVGSLTLSIVNDPGLIGTAIYSQALLVPSPFPATLSNVVSDVLGQ